MTSSKSITRRAALTGVSAVSLATLAAPSILWAKSHKTAQAAGASGGAGKVTEINVLDYDVDPTGRNSSLAGLQQAIADFKKISDNARKDDPMAGFPGAILKIPPNMVNDGFYAIDGSLDLTRIRGFKNYVDARGASLLISAKDKVGLDFTHSSNLVWDGGNIVGDKAAMPLCGVQVARKYLEAKDENPSSHKHSFSNLNITGHWSRAALYNFSSEMLHLQKCRLENYHPAEDAYAAVQDGQSGYFQPVSEFETMGIESKRQQFDANYWHHVNLNRPNGGPCLFMSACVGHRYHRTLFNCYGSDQIHVYQGGRDRKGLLDCLIEGRFETGETDTTMRFIGGPDHYHRRVKLHPDRIFATNILNTGDGVDNVRLIDLDLTVNDFVSPKETHYLAADPGDFTRVTGVIIARSRNYGDSGHARLENLNLPQFKGKFTVSDRTLYTPDQLPHGDYELHDDVPGEPPQWVHGAAPEIMGVAGEWSAAISDAAGTTSKTAITGTWRRSEGMIHLFFDGLSGIDTGGLAASDAARIVIPFRTTQTALGQLWSEDGAAMAVLERDSNAVVLRSVAGGAIPVSALAGGAIRAFQIAFVEKTG